MTEVAVPSEVVDDQRRKAALLRAIGLDKVTESERELALAIAKKYELDLLLRHAMIIDGKLYVTRDGLLWIAHRSGMLDGIEVTEPEIVTLPGVGEFWRAICSVYRKDMSRPFVYAGRYPVNGQNRKFAPEMAVKTAEVMALRRAFNVSAPAYEERWDLPTVQADVDAVSTPQQPPRTLAERVQERRASVGPPISSRPAGPSPDEDDEVTQSMGVRGWRRSGPRRPPSTTCPTTAATRMRARWRWASAPGCKGHRGPHESGKGTWPQ